nr:odorant binding protein 13 [Antheraea pernyi]
MFRVAVFTCFLLMATIPHFMSAMNAEQKAKIHEHFETIGLNCIKDHVITEDDITNLRAHKVPTGPNAPCFLACIMKDVGLMNDEGMLQKEPALELAKTFFDDAEELKNIEDYLHSCAHVNEEAVGDGEKGCERALLSLKCMTENASKFGFDI